jgi:hypothetical protein
MLLTNKRTDLLSREGGNETRDKACLAFSMIAYLSIHKTKQRDVFTNRHESGPQGSSHGNWGHTKVALNIECPQLQLFVSVQGI